MFKRALYLYIFFILVQGVLASPQSFSSRIRGEVYLRNFVLETGVVPLSRVLLVRNADSDTKNILDSISVRVDNDKITVLPVDVIRTILADRDIGIDVIVGERVIFLPSEISSYKSVVEKLISLIYKRHEVRGRIEFGPLSGGLPYQLDNLATGELISTNFVMLDKKQGKGLLYVNYRTDEGDSSVLRFVVNSKSGQIDSKNTGSNNKQFYGSEERKRNNEAMVKSGMPVKIIFVNGGIVVKAEGYCADSGRYFYGDTVKVRPVSTRKYFIGKVVGKGEVLVEIK